jgi:hypothetical protein
VVAGPSLMVLGLLTWALPVVPADDAGKNLEQPVAALERLLKHFRRDGDEVIIQGANLHIVNGLGSTNCADNDPGEPIPNCPNGLGNLIVGYNEPRDGDAPTVRTGSHNVVVGRGHNFSSFGGLVVGSTNEISGAFASVSGGNDNKALASFSSISGGRFNETGDEAALVSGGQRDEALGPVSSVSGGESNVASGIESSISGGKGITITEDTDHSWAAGSIGDEVTGSFRSQ